MAKAKYKRRRSRESGPRAPRSNRGPSAADAISSRKTPESAVTYPGGQGRVRRRRTAGSELPALLRRLRRIELLCCSNAGIYRMSSKNHEALARAVLEALHDAKREGDEDLVQVLLAGPADGQAEGEGGSRTIEFEDETDVEEEFPTTKTEETN